jgi:predicted  nucleic acid-binding Zn-ribbon protein
VRGQHSGLGAAALRARRCEGCRLEINGADLRELAGKADDEVLRCPECSRILVRTAESGL